MVTLPCHFVSNASPALPHAGCIGLCVPMAVVTALFSLPILAYVMWMREPDWMPVPHPVLLQRNTGVLALTNAVTELARRVRAHLTTRLLAGDALAALFVFG